MTFVMGLPKKELGFLAGPRARVGLGSPRVPSSFARPELRCSRRPERSRAALGGPGRGRQCLSRGRARHTHCAQPPGGFPACWPARGNKFALCFPRAQPRLPCSGFGPGPACGGNSGSRTDREPGDFVSNDCGCSGLSSKRRPESGSPLTKETDVHKQNSCF
ncbi:hypothetical protein J1605_018395 [Eschrichtius robustus]|uniref:Uncharacterized protein n=1 Tax=Eschrichtius robustus TaxID=9764 RepID=A0AB34HX64_ESCRO|nr:hypothetical protein J1605_018395 [Eschrichtius robustus]